MFPIIQLILLYLFCFIFLFFFLLLTVFDTLIIRATQDMAMKKDFKRSSEFTSRSSRPETFTDVTRGREVIVRRESLPTQSSAIDPRQVKERFVV